MKTICFLLGGCLIPGMLAGGLASAQTPSGAAVEPELQGLRQQVVELQARVRTLEERLKQMEAAPSARRLPRVEIRPAEPVPPSAPVWRLIPEWVGASSATPKIWGRREVNGWTVYYVPCAEGR